jgi:hypothetical protein
MPTRDSLANPIQRTINNYQIDRAYGNLKKNQQFSVGDKLSNKKLFLC